MSNKKAIFILLIIIYIHNIFFKVNEDYPPGTPRKNEYTMKMSVSLYINKINTDEIFTQAIGRDWSGPKGSVAETGLRSQLDDILLSVVHVWQALIKLY